MNERARERDKENARGKETRRRGAVCGKRKRKRARDQEKRGRVWKTQEDREHAWECETPKGWEEKDWEVKGINRFCGDEGGVLHERLEEASHRGNDKRHPF